MMTTTRQLVITARTDERFDVCTQWLSPAGWRPLTRATVGGFPVALVTRIAARPDYRIVVRSEQLAEGGR